MPSALPMASTRVKGGYDCAMRLSWLVWALVGAMIFGGLTWIPVVHNSSSDLSVRIGSWAQLLAAAGALGAAALALSTARENRAQTEHANVALASATRPRFSMHLSPGMEHIPRLEPNGPVSVSIMNLSPFDAPRFRVDWHTADGTPCQAWGGPLLADPSPSKGFVSEHVSYIGGHSTAARVALGSACQMGHSKYLIRLYYSSQFGNGGWMEAHHWERWDTSDDPENPFWRSRHTVESPKWMTLSEMGF